MNSMGSVNLDMLAEKRILFFTGLTHHFDRLVPLVNKLKKAGANVICATTQNVNFGCDFKGDFEVPLVRGKVNYVFLPEQFEAGVANLLVLNYRRAERAIDEAVKAAPAWSSELPVAAVRLRTMIGLEHDRLCERLLDSVDPELLIVLHEFNAWTKPLCAQASNRGIPVLSFLEGIPYQTLPAGTFKARFSDKVCLWGQSHVRRLVDDGTDPDKLAVTGAMHLDVVRQKLLDQANESRKKYGLPADKKILLMIMPRLCFLPAMDEILSTCWRRLCSRATITTWRSSGTLTSASKTLSTCRSKAIASASFSTSRFWS